MLSLPDLFAAIRWWVVLLMVGTAVFPLAAHFFKALPDRGYAFSKMLGLLLLTYLFWLLGSFGFLQNNLGGILFALALVFGLSGWTLWRQKQAGGPSLPDWLRENWRQVALTELLFALLFFLWVWVRAQNPAIAATEKPMEFAFLNAASRSPAMPPLDPWLSGYAISYYYFGYVMTAVLARLAAVPEAIAFNLAIAWLVAGTGIGAFGLVYNLIALRGTRTAALLFGVVAAFALPLAGNQQITLEVLHGNGLGSAEFWEWLNVRDINSPPNPDTPPRYEGGGWWWWRASRPIHEHHLSGRPEEGLEPIAEFPAFSFNLGDLHPHVLALPFAFLSLAVGLVWWINSQQLTVNSERGTGNAKQQPLHNSQFTIHNSQFTLPLLFTSLVLGGLAFLNTWDVLIHLFVVVGAFALGRWRTEGWSGRVIWQALAFGGVLLALSALLYLPFFLGFRSQAGAPYLLPMLMRPTRLAQFMIIFAMPLWAITIWLVALAARQRFRGWQTGVLTAVFLLLILYLLTFLFSWIVASSADGAGRVINLANELGQVLPPRPDGGVVLGWGLTAVGTILPAFLANRLAYPALSLYLAALIALIVMIWIETQGSGEKEQGSRGDKEQGRKDATPLPFVLLLIFTGALLTLGPEFLYIRDNFGQRLNTIFKFYYQAWVLFGVAALFGLDHMQRYWRQGTGRVAPLLALGGYGLMFAFALLFPYYGAQSRAAEFRGPASFPERQAATLDGLAHVARFNPDEYAAIQWLRENVSGTPVILEAVGGQYSAYGRISAATGLPTLLGWAGHQYQWRGSTPEPARRDPVVRDIYTLSDWPTTAALLDQYDVTFIYVGNLEREAYGQQVADKFANRLEIAFQSGNVTIYRWR